jgi:hypothetical protein
MIALICFVLAVLASPFKTNIRLEAENVKPTTVFGGRSDDICSC